MAGLFYVRYADECYVDVRNQICLCLILMLIAITHQQAIASDLALRYVKSRCGAFFEAPGMPQKLLKSNKSR